MTIPPGATNIVKLPLAFVRSGRVRLDYGSVSNVGGSGYAWSRAAKSSTYAYTLLVDSANVFPSYNYGDRYHGFSLRCLYPGN